jgi:sn-glycerol 3-phosphate transport system ATP-binding protein
MSKGEVQQIGTTDEIYNRPANTFVASFMGSPPMSMMSGSVRGGTLQIAGAEIAVVAAPDGPVTVGVRPEHVEVQPSSTVGTVPATIDFCEPLGSHVLVNALVDTADAPPARVIAQASPETFLAAGAGVGLKLRADRTYLFDAETGSAQLARERISVT